MHRGQATVTAIEAVVGVLILMSVVIAFGLGVPSGDEASTQAQLDTYAADAGTLLVNEPPRHQDQTRLAEVTASQAAFDREKPQLEERISRILPDNVMFRVQTEYGTVGYPMPAEVQTGERTLLTPNGEVTLEVWYA